MGHLGQAITKYFYGRGLKLKITTAFRHRPREGRPDDRRHSVPPYGDIRGGGRGQGHRHRHRLVSLARSRRTGRPDRQRRHQGRAQLHLAGRSTSRAASWSRTTTSPRCSKRSPISSRRTRRTRPTTERGTMKVFHGIRPAPRIPPPGGYRRIVRRRTRRSQRVARGRAPASPANATAESIVVTFSPHPRIVLEHRPICACSRRSTRRSGCSNGQASTIGRHPFYPRIQPDGFRRFHPPRPDRKTGRRNTRNGYNHHFGHNKEGDYGSLRSSERPTLRLYRIEPFSVGGEKVSSTVVRCRSSNTPRWPAAPVCWDIPIC